MPGNLLNSIHNTLVENTNILASSTSKIRQKNNGSVINKKEKPMFNNIKYEYSYNVLTVFGK